MLLVILFLLIVAPFITIAALNTLFGLSIAYSFWNWLSVVWLTLVFGGAAASIK